MFERDAYRRELTDIRERLDLGPEITGPKLRPVRIAS
jgi:hypothetical protein